VPRTFVVNASPLILLARVQRLDLLTSVANTVLVPEAVLAEVDAGDDRDGAGTAVRAASALQLIPNLEIPRSIRLWDLGVGESQVLAKVLEAPGSEAILDDRTARRCGESLGIPKGSDRRGSPVSRGSARGGSAAQTLGDGGGSRQSRGRSK
jgi:predicted nucleic acid-binding protein